MGVSMESWSPPPSWRAEFERQATQDLIKRATKYARKRVRMVQRVGRKVDPLYARELVLDAVGDTLDGTRKWDPDERPLLNHVIATVFSRTGHEVVRAAHQRHRSLDDSADDNSSDGRPLEAEASRTLASLATRSLDAAEVHARRAVEALRHASGGNELIGVLLDAFEQGKTERREVMEWTGWSARTYDNVRRYLVRLVDKLPAEVREIAAELLA